MSQAMRKNMQEQRLAEAEQADNKGQTPLDLKTMVLAQADERGVIAMIHWAEDDDVTKDADALALLDGNLEAAFDLDGDGTVDEAELQYQERIIAAAGDFLLAQGILQDDIDTLWGYDPDDEDEAEEALEVAERVREALKQALPDDEDELAALPVDFVYDQGAAVAMDDGMTSVRKDASGKKFTYRKVKAVRNGKVTLVAKRVGGGAFKLSPKQKMHLKKIQAKAHTLQRQVKWQVSMLKRKKAGL